ncbi:MAG: putative quinol monooxygenase [Planctomycetaceae bacterium]|jgi:quinol monooxygenase YgiN
MIYLNVHITVKNAADIETVRQCLVELTHLSRAEPGCVRYEVYHSHTDPSKFEIVERWADQAALDGHRKAQGYTEIYAPRVIPLVDRTPHPSTLLA